METPKELLEIFSPEDLEKLDSMNPMKMLGSLKVGEYKGHHFTPGFSPTTTKFLYEEWTPKTGDVFIISYPKTGTNWMVEIVRQILYQDGKWNKISRSIPMLLKLLEVGDSGKLEILDKLPMERRLLGSHLPADLVNLDKIKQVKAKVIYVLRNPKDQIVSWYKFIPSVPPGKIEPIKSMVNNGWDNYFEHVVAGDFPVSMKPGEWYPEHILSWYKHWDNKTVQFIYYEDLKKDLPEQIKLIAEFLEAPVTDETANKIAEECTFNKMKENMLKGTSAENRVAAMNMRKGGVGGWKDYFTVSQSERIDAIMEEKLKDTDIKFTYEL